MPLYHPALMVRCDTLYFFFMTMLMVPAIAWVLNSAVAARRISIRSIKSGDRLSIENPGGGLSPSMRICV